MTAEQYLALSELAYLDLSGFSLGTNLDDVITGLGPQPQYNFGVLSSTASSWKLVSYQDNTSSGFAGIALKNTMTGQIVFSFRGSEFGNNEDLMTKAKDLYADAQFALPDAPMDEPNQFRDAYTFVKDTLNAVTGSTMTESQLSTYVANNGTAFTGHSLGGALTQYVIWKMNAGTGTTFDNPGIGQALGVTNSGAYNITDYVNADDIVGNYGVQLGSTVYLRGTADLSGVDMQAIQAFFGITTQMVSGQISPADGALRLGDAFGGMNQATRDYFSNGWMSAHDPNNLHLSEPTTSSDIDPLMNQVSDFADAVATSPIPDAVAGAVNLGTGVTTIDDATGTFSSNTVSLVGQTVERGWGIVQQDHFPLKIYCVMLM